MMIFRFQDKRNDSEKIEITRNVEQWDRKKDVYYFTDNYYSLFNVEYIS